MSLDTGIYMAEFPDGFRVIHAQCIENVTYHKEGSVKWKKEMDSYFGKVEVFKDKDKAFHKLLYLNKEHETEYGIHEIGKFDYVPKK